MNADRNDLDIIRERIGLGNGAQNKGPFQIQILDRRPESPRDGRGAGILDLKTDTAGPGFGNEIQFCPGGRSIKTCLPPGGKMNKKLLQNESFPGGPESGVTVEIGQGPKAEQRMQKTAIPQKETGRFDKALAELAIDEGEERTRKVDSMISR